VVKRDTAPIGAPCWVELFTSDPATSRAFYHEILGWTSEDADPKFGGYVNFSHNGVRVAGCFRNDGSAGTPDVWSVYLASDDAKATVDAAVEHGGSVIVPATDVAELGTMAVVTDAGGAAIGIWQPGEHTGFGVLAEPGSPGWFELHTRDYDTVVDFYRTVFHWPVHEQTNMPGFRYATHGKDDDALAGIMDAATFLADGDPAHWSVYFTVADTDATLARVEQLGGSTVLGPEDTPYGRLAVASDPTGAEFKLVAN
jgi:predicted enzyme related to lactoylglutathione lyase